MEMTNRNMTILGYYIIADSEGSIDLRFFKTAAAAELELQRMADNEYGEYSLGEYGFKTLCQYHLDEAASEQDVQRYFDDQRARQHSNDSDDDLIFDTFDI